MRVLHLCAGNLYGGIEVALVSCAGAGDLIEHHFGVCFEGRLADELRPFAAVHVLGPARFSRPWSLARTRARLLLLLDRLEFDAVICHGGWIQALFGSLAARRPEVFAYFAHDASTSAWTDRLARLTGPDLALANSRYTRDRVAPLFPRTRWDVLYCPVRPLPPADQERSAVRAANDTGRDQVVILQASRIEPGKGHLLHLRALALLRDEPSWTLWVAGGPQRRREEAYFSSLRAEAKQLGIEDRVRFLGQRSDVPSLLRAADIFCQPNTIPEPFGIAFIEAFQAGLTVVSTGLGGTAEILTTETAELCAPTPAAVATGLRRLITDPLRRERAAAEARGRALALTDAGAQVGALAKLLTDAAASKHSARRAR